MDEILLIFPVLAQDIFKHLDDKNLVKCRKVNKNWKTFLDNDSLLWRRKIQKYVLDEVEFSKDWELVTRKVPVKILKPLALAVEEFFISPFIPFRYNKKNLPHHSFHHIPNKSISMLK